MKMNAIFAKNIGKTTGTVLRIISPDKVELYQKGMFLASKKLSDSNLPSFTKKLLFVQLKMNNLVGEKSLDRFTKQLSGGWIEKVKYVAKTADILYKLINK